MKKIKQYFIENEKGKKIVSICTTVLLGLCSFMFGRASKSDLDKGISIEYPSTENALGSDLNDNIGQNTSKIEENMQSEGDNSAYQASIGSKSSRKGEYFASSRGKKYYPVGCSAGKNIKMENRIYFSTSIEAENSGYVISSSCK